MLCCICIHIYIHTQQTHSSNTCTNKNILLKSPFTCGALSLALFYMIWKADLFIFIVQVSQLRSQNFKNLLVTCCFRSKSKMILVFKYNFKQALLDCPAGIFFKAASYSFMWLYSSNYICWIDCHLSPPISLSLFLNVFNIKDMCQSRRWVWSLCLCSGKWCVKSVIGSKGAKGEVRHCVLLFVFCLLPGKQIDS